jgi:hypothetical protein
MRVDHRRNGPPKSGITGVEESCRSAPVFKGWQSAASPNQARAQAKSQNVWCDDCGHVHCATHESFDFLSVTRYFPLQRFAIAMKRARLAPRFYRRHL